jgi:hypothetical protein
MSTLLFEVAGNRELNHTVFPPRLLIYDDHLVYSKRRFFKVNEISIAYSHIAQVNLLRGIFFARMEIDTNAGMSVEVKYVPKKEAIKAKTMIDRKIYNALAKNKSEPVTTIGESESYEKALSRLKELHGKGKISEKEYKKRKADFLKKLR